MVFTLGRPYRQHGFMTLVMFGAAAAVSAQTPPNIPDAGTLQREAERDLRRPVPAPQLLAPPVPMKQAAKGVTVTVKSFSIEGATLVPAAELGALLNDQVGKSLTFTDLEQAAQRLAEHYRTLGWFARVYLPEQDITSGVVRIVVIEGRLGAVQIDKSQAMRADADFVNEMVTADMPIGQPLAAVTLERNLLLANDLSGIRTTGILEAGDKIGETRLNIKVEDTNFVTGDLGLNNQGVKATGVMQLSGGLALNDLSGRGDRLDARALVANNLNSVRVSYGVPLAANGTRLNLRLSELTYHLGDRFAALDAKGRASSGGADISYPIVRSQDSNLNLSGGLDARRSADDSLGIAIRRHNVDALNFTLSGDEIDGWQGGGLTQYAVGFVHGKLDLNGIATDLAADQNLKAQGTYNKLSGQALRLQRLDGDFTLSLKLAVQWADKNLDSSEQMSLGGPAGVRAYPVNEANGDEGWLMKVELRRPIADGWQAFGFLDSGNIRLHRNPWPGIGNTPNSYQLSGAGIGVAWNRPGDWNIALTIATPLGSNAGRDVNGNNSDGSGQHSTRAWLDASKLF